MAVKIRLTRLGKKKQPTYRVVVMDSRKPRDGEYIEQLGIYDPRQDPSLVSIDNERALHWLQVGAQPSERAQKLLEISGAWTQFKVARGDIHTIGGDAVAPKAQPAPDVIAAETVEQAEAAVESDVPPAEPSDDASVATESAESADTGEEE